MNAEIIAGDAFSIKPSLSSDQISTLNSATVWLWFVTAMQEGKHRVAVSISVPVNVGDQKNNYEIKRLEFEIDAAAPEPTPIPTSTPIPSFETQLQGSAVQISLAVLGSAVTVVVAIIGVIFANKRLVLRKKKIRKAIEDKKREEDIKRTKDGLPTSRKK